MGATLRGVLELNLLLLVTGLAVLWAARGFRSWLEVLDGLGLALLLGVSTIGVLATLVLVAGGGLSYATILGLCAVVSGAAALVAVSLRRTIPRSFGRLPRLSVATVAAALCALASVLILVALVRVAHVMPLGGGDSFEDWVPKAKVIYFDGSIYSSLFKSLPAGRHPLLVPALQAMDFRFMGSAFAPQLAVQYWLLFAGFVFAAAALLRRLVPTPLAWLFVGLACVIPQLDLRVLNAQADWALDIQFAIAALFAVSWLRNQEGWLLIGLTIMLAGTIATKQEGLLLAGCLYAGLALATCRRLRSTWPPLFAAGVVAYLVNLPFRIWWDVEHLPIADPTVSLSRMLSDPDRAWTSFHLVLRLVFAYDMWLAIVPLTIAAAAAALTLSGGARESALLYLGTFTVGVLGFTYILWDDFTYVLDEQQSSTPFPRVVGSLVLFSTVLAPVLIAPLLAEQKRHTQAQ